VYLLDISAGFIR